MAGVILYRGLYFGLYDSLKPVVLRGDLKDSVVASFVLGWGITLGAGLAAYPFDTICRRMMTTVRTSVAHLYHQHLHTRRVRFARCSIFTGERTQGRAAAHAD